MNKKFDWDKTIDNIQFGMLWFVVSILVICVSVLILFDVLAGAGVMTYLTNGNVPASIFISLATSGLLISLMVLGYSASSNTNKKTISIGKLIGVVAFGVYCLDVYFDSMTADYLRFNQIMVLKDIPNYQVHLLFRILIGGISTVGEALAMAIILGMPILKEIINKAIPESMRTSNNNQNNSSQSQPSHNNNGQSQRPMNNGASQNHGRVNGQPQNNQSQKPIQSNMQSNQNNRPTPRPAGIGIQASDQTYHPISMQSKMDKEEIEKLMGMAE